MTNFDPSPGDELFLIVSAGGPVVHIIDRIERELEAGQALSVIATPQAAEWIDHEAVHRLTGRPLYSQMLTPAAPTLTPLGNRVLATPVTLNTLTKWADGHADNLAIGLLCEALGSDIPITAELSLSWQFANHPAAGPAIERLQSAGAELVFLDPELSLRFD